MTDTKAAPKTKAKPPASTQPVSPLDRYTIFTRAEDGSPIGVSSFNRAMVKDVIYNATRHCLHVTLDLFDMNGETKVQQIQNTKIEQGNVVKLPSYSVHDLFFMEGGNRSLTVTDEADMINLWSWIHQGSTINIHWKDLLELRKSVTAKIAAFKEEKEKQAKEQKEKSENGKQSPIVNIAGDPISSSK